MSKILKFIVNLFLIAAIIIAVAILVPPLAGVTTTIVDTPAMNTNLPLGSITYSTDINVYDIKPGDVILKENDSSTYAYVIHETDPANGRFVAVSGSDESGPEEEIILRNSVSKVAVVVPLIGYIIMAMHSVEGIVIIVLVVVLMIIMFILSELWRHTPEEEEEEENKKQEEEQPAQVSASEETGIDTAAIKEAVEENNTAVLNEDAALAAGDDAEVDAAAAAGLAGVGAAAVISQDSPEWVQENGDDSLKTEKQLDEDLSNSTEELYQSLTKGQDPEGDSSYKSDFENEGSFEDKNSFEEKTGFEDKNSFDSISDVEKTSDFEKEVDQEKLFQNSFDRDSEMSLDSLADEMKDRAAANGTDGSAAAEVNEAAKAAGIAGIAGAAGAAGVAAIEGIEDVDESELAAAEAEFFGVPVEEPIPPSSEPVNEEERFTPIPRPMLDEIVGQARESGKEPVVRKDERSGVSIVDVSDSL